MNPWDEICSRCGALLRTLNGLPWCGRCGKTHPNGKGPFRGPSWLPTGEE